LMSFFVRPHLLVPFVDRSPANRLPAVADPVEELR
jgi:hypothetical protein